MRKLLSGIILFVSIKNIGGRYHSFKGVRCRFRLQLKHTKARRKKKEENIVYEDNRKRDIEEARNYGDNITKFSSLVLRILGASKFQRRGRG